MTQLDVTQPNVTQLGSDGSQIDAASTYCSISLIQSLSRGCAARRQLARARAAATAIASVARRRMQEPDWLRDAASQLAALSGPGYRAPSPVGNVSTSPPVSNVTAVTTALAHSSASAAADGSPALSAAAVAPALASGGDLAPFDSLVATAADCSPRTVPLDAAPLRLPTDNSRLGTLFDAVSLEAAQSGLDSSPLDAAQCGSRFDTTQLGSRLDASQPASPLHVAPLGSSGSPLDASQRASQFRLPSVNSRFDTQLVASLRTEQLGTAGVLVLGSRRTSRRRTQRDRLSSCAALSSPSSISPHSSALIAPSLGCCSALGLQHGGVLRNGLPS